MAEAPDIQLPQLDGESTAAYHARVAYVTSGPDRDLRTVAQQLHKSVTLIGRWSARHNWMEHARRYDETLASLQAQQAAQQYLAALEDNRERYLHAGRALYNLAVAMLADTERQRAALKHTPATLLTVSRALTTAADLEAHALGLGTLIGKLDTYEES